MILCSDGHDEVCYDSRRCPACELNFKIDDLVDQTKRQEKAIDNLQNENMTLLNRVEELESK